LCSAISQVVKNSVVITLRKLFSIIAFVGSRCSTAIRFLKIIERCNSRAHSIFLIAPVTDSMGAQYIAHLTATSISEIYRNHGHLFQAAYDDLSKHAVAYRQLCLFLRKPAGREAYPSDVFYLHARLLERSCNLGGVGYYGALMSLPVIETLNNDLSAYIATNVISITDGQLYLDLTLFGLGQCPAISTEKSVSRVGAKSLDELSRNSAFALYSIVGSVKQEADNTNKSEGFLLRYSRYKKFTLWLIQRSSQAKSISTAGNLAIHTGILDIIPSTCLSIFLLFIADYSFSNLGIQKYLIDRLFTRENQVLIEITGHQAKFLLTFILELRLAVTVTFLLTAVLHTIASSLASISSSILLTLNAVTSFLVDIKDNINTKPNHKK